MTTRPEIVAELIERGNSDPELLRAPLSLLMDYNFSLGAIEAAAWRNGKAHDCAIKGSRLLKEKGMGVKWFLLGGKVGKARLLHIPRYKDRPLSAPLCGAPAGPANDGAAFVDGAVLCKSCVRLHLQIQALNPGYIV